MPKRPVFRPFFFVAPHIDFSVKMVYNTPIALSRMLFLFGVLKNDFRPSSVSPPSWLRDPE